MFTGLLCNFRPTGEAKKSIDFYLNQVTHRRESVGFFTHMLYLLPITCKFRKIWKFRPTKPQKIFLITSLLLLWAFVLFSPSEVKVFHVTPNDKVSWIEQCPETLENALNIHLIAHTHDDVGWIRTVDDYYNLDVRSILDSTIRVLLNNKNYRFTYVEMAYFHRWWSNQTVRMQRNVRQLVCDGRLQFVLGGWVMSDEATVYYGDEISQLTRGHSFIRNVFGACGRTNVAWQIDPFGHARDRAELFQQVGYQALFVQRIDFGEKQTRRRTRGLELLWDSHTHDDIDRCQSKLFTHILYDGYCYPSGAGLDERLLIPEENLNETFEVYSRAIEKWSAGYLTNHLMVPLGCDFTYTNAEVNFRLSDELKRYLNGTMVRGRPMNVIYSTPACYLRAMNRFTAENSIKLPSKTGDFFPNSELENNYWTGFYTSRPTIKAIVRQYSGLLRMAEQLQVIVRPPSTTNLVIDKLRQQLAILQHHDAITGTSTQLVAEDYLKNLQIAASPCEDFISSAIHTLTGGAYNESNKFCHQTSIGLCPVTDSLTAPNEHHRYVITVYNSIGWSLSRNYWIRFPIDLSKPGYQEVLVEDYHRLSRPLSYQLLPITSRTKSIPERYSANSTATHELFFNPTEGDRQLPAMGFVKFIVSLRKKPTKAFPINLKLEEHFRFSLLPGPRGVHIHAKHSSTGTMFNLSIEMLYYMGSVESTKVSGAYVFRPSSDSTEAIPIGPPRFETINGTCFQQVEVNYADWATLIVRLYQEDNHLEVEWTVGPIPDDEGTSSREVIIRYTVIGAPEILSRTAGEFFTDSTGRRLIRRVRKTHSTKPSAPNSEQKADEISGNYYPIVNRILLKGYRKQWRKKIDRNLTRKLMMPPIGLAIYTDRAQGGTSLMDGQLELMVHRRLVQDDVWGVGESLMENGVDGKGLIVRGNHWVHLDELRFVETKDREFSLRVTQPPKLLFHRVPNGFRPSLKSWNGLNKPLPDHIHLLDVISWPLEESTSPSSSANNTPIVEQLLLRLEHIGSRKWIGSTKLDLTELFRKIEITRIEEMNLTADRSKASVHMEALHWPGHMPLTSSTPNDNQPWKQLELDSGVVQLHPGTIHTFICDYVRL